ncbi:MAG: alpha/beta hydrolase [Asticcacaulis sp.]|uniref:alpha/beta hydrolase n=1 Tax=Asticcacaulis sp. TaxID=1872648 RepID=UPI003F7CCC1C
MVSDVSQPTMTFYRAKGENTGVTLLVFPGGGYKKLAIDLEGTEVCDWATARGLNCVVLKYRVPDGGPHHDPKCNCETDPPHPLALQDAQRAIGLLRLRSVELGINPQKIGVVGFSAGGRLAADVSTHAHRAYEPKDEADQKSSVPNFAVLLYPGHLWDARTGQLRNDIVITPITPPTLIIQADDDPVDPVIHGQTYYRALRAHEIPAEIHTYAKGGHAFGLRRTQAPITHWPDLLEPWLSKIGMLPTS